MTNPLHIKLNQKILDLDTGEAFAPPNSRIKRMRDKWDKASRKKKISAWWAIFGVGAVGASVTGILCLSTITKLFGDNLPGSIFFTLVSVVPLFPALILNIWDDERQKFSPQTIVDLLALTIQRHPNLKDSVNQLFNHLDHPNIKKEWWKDIVELLNDINDIEHSKQSLATLLDQNMVLVDPIELDDEHAISLSKTSHMKILMISSAVTLNSRGHTAIMNLFSWGGW